MNVIGNDHGTLRRLGRLFFQLSLDLLRHKLWAKGDVQFVAVNDMQRAVKLLNTKNPRRRV